MALSVVQICSGLLIIFRYVCVCWLRSRRKNVILQGSDSVHVYMLGGEYLEKTV
jgi:hypothetical protein